MTKKNFRKIPLLITNQLRRLGERYIVVGCSHKFTGDEISSGKLKHLGIEIVNEQLTFEKSIIPPETSGKFSDRNINGYVIVRKDLPKQTLYNTIESPNWGDSYYGTHTVNLPYQAYPRDFQAPGLSEIKVSTPPQTAGQNQYVIIFEVDQVLDTKSPSFKKDLLNAINILQENVGYCGVQKAGADTSDYLKSLTVSWEILPPGTKEEVVARIFGKRIPTPHEKATVEDRYTFLMNLKPKDLIIGLSGIQRYFGALLKDNLVIFENIEYGNAIYVMFDEWKELSKRSRTELLSGRYGKNFERVVHSKGWKGTVTEIVKKNS